MKIPQIILWVQGVKNEGSNWVNNQFAFHTKNLKPYSFLNWQCQLQNCQNIDKEEVLLYMSIISHVSLTTLSVYLMRWILSAVVDALLLSNLKRNLTDGKTITCIEFSTLHHHCNIICFGWGQNNWFCRFLCDRLAPDNMCRKLQRYQHPLDAEHMRFF